MAAGKRGIFNWTMAIGLAHAASSVAWGQAGGIAFPDQGTPISGTALAGQAAVARDASTSWLNPAGLTRLDGTQAMLGIQPFNLSVEFDPAAGTSTSGNDGGDAGDWFVGGSAYVSHKLSDEITLGFSFTAPFGSTLDYDDDWVGRYFVNDVDLLVVNLQPAIGVQLTETVSIGAGLDIQYADLEQTIAVNRPFMSDGRVRIDGDSWDVGASVGLLYEPSESTRIGVRYRSEVEHELTGDLTIFNARDKSASLTVPQSVTASVYHTVNDRISILGDVGWTDWSAFDETVITVNLMNPAQIQIPRDFKDTWHVGLGMHYRPSDDWLVMTGLSYVSSSVDDGDRTPDIPVDEQWRFSLGFEHVVSDQLRVGMYYSIVDLGDNDIDNELNAVSGRLVGDYDAHVHLIGLYAAWQF